MFDSSASHVSSYYAASCIDLQTPRPALRQDLDVDVVVIGAGYTGLYTALNLAQAGKSVAIVEASRVGWGASGRNGGQIILGFSCDMPPFEAALGTDGARRIWQLIQDAATEIRNRILDHQIDCDLAEGHLWTSVQHRRIHLLTDWQEEAARKWGYEHLRLLDKAALRQHVNSDRYEAGLLDTQGGHLHPLKYVLGLARAAENIGVRIFEQTQALGYEQMPEEIRLRTAKGTVRAQALVLACNAYIDRLEPHLKNRILPVGTYMIATEPLGESLSRSLLPSNCAVSDNQFILDYFRLSSDHRLLFGGKCSYTGRTPLNLTESMRSDMLKVFPQLTNTKIDFTWGGHIDITMARTPHLGSHGPVFWAQGFSGHGLIPTCVAGKVIAKAILGDNDDLSQFMRLNNRPFPGGETLAGFLQVLGMSYYRLRDYF